MSLRPATASWFEMVTRRKDVSRAVACLARTGAVELETGEEVPSRYAIADLGRELKSWRDRRRRYAVYWPKAGVVDDLDAEISQQLAWAVGQLDLWQKQADPIIERLERIDVEVKELSLLADALHRGGAELPPLDLLANPGTRIVSRLVAYPGSDGPKELPAVLVRRIEAPATTFFLAIGRAADIRDLDAQTAASKATNVPLPSWLPAGRDQAIDEIALRRTELGQERGRLEVSLSELADAHDLLRVLGTMRQVEWLSVQSEKLRTSDRLVWVTGWTSDRQGETLRRALHDDGVRALVRIADAPRDRDIPIVMRNAPWVRGFEALVRMLGTPAQSEADPSSLLAVIAPLLFGFMFGDIGQGLVLVAAGVAMQSRVPYLRILIPGGLMAAVFGALFGSVFAREDVIPALWHHPIAHPVEILVAALAIGSAILTLGLLLDAAQSHWRGEAARWWASRAGLTLAYAGFVGSPLRFEAAWLIPLGGLWFVIGAALQGRTRRFGEFLGALLGALAQYIEQALQLAINTVSFARVGAFALAHAGLSAAVVGVAEAAGGIGYWIVLVIGNVMIIALEGLVVAIQTTRLVLFEFFIRFLKGGGRAFQPLAPPGGNHTAAPHGAQPAHVRHDTRSFP